MVSFGVPEVAPFGTIKNGEAFVAPRRTFSEVRHQIFLSLFSLGIHKTSLLIYAVRIVLI
jgi:hypothetical protein